MSGPSKIEWTEKTWNPVTGCTKVSPGCDHCYAETFAERWRGIPGHPYEQGFDLKLWPERLQAPLSWRKPSLVFVNSMSDLFHARVPFEFVQQVWQTMEETPQHTYQILTKRPDRMARFSQRLTRLPNVWLGTSIEDQERVSRLDHLLNTHAFVRFVSAEPLLGPLEIEPYLAKIRERPWGGWRPAIDWVIVGGESGPKARLCELDWIRGVLEQCQQFGVAFFCKQLGSVWARGGRTNSKGGDMTDWPEDLRIRQLPRYVRQLA